METINDGVKLSVDVCKPAVLVGKVDDSDVKSPVAISKVDIGLEDEVSRVVKVSDVEETSVSSGGFSSIDDTPVEVLSACEVAILLIEAP